MFATFEEFLAQCGRNRLRMLTEEFADASDPDDSPKRRDPVERALTQASNKIRAYAKILDPTNEIVKEWCLTIALIILGRASGSATVLTEIDLKFYDEVMKALERAKDGDFPWETEADQDIPTGPTDGSTAGAGFVPITSCSPYSLHRSRW